jgi:photosystem II stability/assembly factor-like uncharacterized protein
MFSRKQASIVVLAVIFCLAGTAWSQATPSAPQAQIDNDTFAGYTARSIGPAVMGGRISAITALPGKRLTIYVGAAAGGIFKSEDGGVTFKPIFDKVNSSSIGAMAIDPNNPKVIWVGTGESWMRNSVSVGDGVYKSTDGGENWNKVGLADSEHISRVLIHPKDSNTVYVCALGHAWNDNDERGLYKTTDGGKTWTNILHADARTGCGDVAFDASDPNTLYASLWPFRRYPYSFNSGGSTGGLFKSTDGGATWKKLAAGLPEGDLGRIAIATTPANPKRVWAVVEAKKTALYRSDDSGATWTWANDSFNMIGRPFYFALLVSDPTNGDRVYKPGFGLSVSDDGGRSFASIGAEGASGGVHGDYHALWVDPGNADHLLTGTDGGIYETLDRGAHWRFLNSFPIGQYYHVSADMERPYNVYGGLQDNGTWEGPNTYPDGVYNRHWKNIGYGDGFWSFADPTDDDLIYSEYQGGRLLRVRRGTGEIKEVYPLAKAGDPEYRCNWNTPVHIGATSKALYIGCQFLFRSRDHGESWEKISPDLTTNNPEWLKQSESGGLTIDNSDAEKYETIYTISESPKSALVIWAGTDDGNVQVTQNGGKTWTNLTKNVTGLPPNTWVSTIEASHFEPGTAYATFDGHAHGDMKTYVYKTTDFGKTWTQFTSPAFKSFAHVIREDLVNPKLLWVGTENGLFISIDGGATWAEFNGKIPRVPVRDICIQPRENDVIVATHGRSLYVIDDVTPIRALTADILNKDVAILPSRPSVLALPSEEQRAEGDADYRGASVSDSAVVTIYQKKRHIFGELKVELFDPNGKLLNSSAGDKRRGVVRVELPLREPPPKVPPAASLVEQPFAFFGPTYPEGTYTVKLTKGKETLTSTIKVVVDPRAKSTPQDRDLQRRTVMKLYAMQEHLAYLVAAMTGVRDQARDRTAKSSDAAVKKQMTDLVQKIEEFRATLVSVKEGGGITGERKLREYVGELYGAVNGYEGKPTQQQLDRVSLLNSQLEDVGKKFQAMSAGDVVNANTALQKASLQPITVLTEADWKKQ